MADILVLGKNLSTGQNDAMTSLKVDNSNGQLKSSLSTGTAPLVVASTTLVSNFTSQYLGAVNQDSAYHLDFANMDITSGTWGDVLFRGTSVWERLAAGTSGQYLKSLGTGADPAWASISGTVPVSNTLYSVLTGLGGGGSWVEDAGFLVNAGDVTTGVWKGTPVDEQYGGLGSDFSSGGAGAVNSMLYFSSAGVIAALGPGTDNYVLRSNSGVPTWEAEEALPQGVNDHDTLVWDTSSSNWITNSNFRVDNANGQVTNGEWQATTIAVTKGGTGLTGCSTGDLLKGSGSNTFGILAVVSGSPLEMLQINGAGTDLIYAKALAGGGGTGADSSGWSGVPVVSGGTWSVDSAQLDESHGGTGTLIGGTYTLGDIIFASATNVLNTLGIGAANQVLRVNAGGTAPEWDTFGLNELSDVTIAGAAQGDILYRGASGWANLPKGSSGTFLSSTGTNPVWADPGTAYSWTLAGDTGTPQTISDGNTATIAGGNGIDTVASATDTLTISAKSDVTTGGDNVGIKVASNGLSLLLTDIDGTGIATTGSGELLIDTASTVSFAAGVIWTFPNDVTGKGLFVTGTPVDGNHVTNKTYVDNLITGIAWKNPVECQLLGNIDVDGLIGNLAALTIEGLSPTSGDAYVVTTANGVAALQLAGIGDVWQYVVTTWTRILTGVGGFVPNGAYCLLSTTTALISPYTNNTDDGKRAGFDGISNTGTLVTPTAGDSYAVDGIGAWHVGDIHEWSGSAWVDITIGAGGFVAAGVRAVLGLTPSSVLISPYTDATDDGKIVDFTGSSNTGVDTGDAVDTSAFLFQDDNHVGIFDNLGYVFEGTVPSGSWVQFTGAGQITAGAGLTKTTNTIQVNDGTIGDVNGLAISNDAIALAYNSTFFKLTSNQLDIVGNSLGASEIDETDAYNWSGLHDFSIKILTDVIDESTGNTGVTIDSLLIKDGYATVSEYTGNFWNTNGNVGTINANELVASNGTDSTVDLASATAVSSASVYGVCSTTAATGQPLPLYQVGPHLVKFVGGLTGYTPGDPVYLSLTSGHATFDVSLFGSGNVVIQIGWLQDDTGLSGTTVLGETATVLFDIQGATVLA